MVDSLYLSKRNKKPVSLNDFLFIIGKPSLNEHKIYHNMYKTASLKEL